MFSLRYVEIVSVGWPSFDELRGREGSNSFSNFIGQCGWFSPQTESWISPYEYSYRYYTVSPQSQLILIKKKHIL